MTWYITHTVVNPTGAHIHDSQGLVLDLSPAGFTSISILISGPITDSDIILVSPMNGAAVLLPTEESRFCAGQSYVNIHSQLNPSGELMAVLNGALCHPTPYPYHDQCLSQ
jgi:hypothetical protein